MKPTDSYDDRLEMVKMHANVIKRINTAIENKQSIEACWLCYACFESRIVRTLEKVSVRCSKRKCYGNKNVGIATRIECLKQLKQLEYAGTETFDNQLLGDIRAWCDERNILVHALVTLNNYEGMDEKFLSLAKKGKPLVEQLYKQTTKFRATYYKIENMPEFPEKAETKCRLKMKKTEKE